MRTFNIIFVLSLLAVSTFATDTKNNTSTPEGKVNYLLFLAQSGNHMYEPNGFVVHQDIMQAYHRGVVKKYENPANWHDTHGLWHNRQILRFGIGYDANLAGGLLVKVPEGYNTLWVRVLNDRWFHVRIMSLRNRDSEVENYTAGHRQLNEYSFDGGAPDCYHTVNMWVNIPLRTTGEHVLYSAIHSDSWISGIAFSTNIWNHARNSAVAYHWAVNGGTALRWHTHNWNNDNLASIDAGAIRTLRVPVIPSGRDKLVYLVEHNNNWLGTMHGFVRVGDNKIERFRTTYNNPFATHYNSKMYDRYIAVRVPANLIEAESKFINLEIDMSQSDHHIHIREAGSHDFY